MLPSKQQQQQRRWRREQEGSKQPQPQQQQQQHWAMSSRLLMNSTLCLLLLPLLTLTTTTAGAKMTAGDNQELGVGQWGRQVGLQDQQQQQHHHRRYQQQRNRGSADSLPARHSSSGGGGGGRCDREADVTTLRHRIIRPQDSVSAGARFVSAPRGVSRWRDCLSACCVHAGCSVAVLQGAPGDDDDGGDDGGGGDDRDGPELNCYLFDCPRGQDGRDVCSFSTHQGYTSFVLSENGRAHGGDGDGGGDGDHDEKEEMDRKDEDPERGRHEGEPGGRDGEEDQPPQAQAGADVMLRVPESSATLSGLGSVDDHGITAYSWGLLSGDPSLQMASSEDGQLKLSGLREGVYVLRLTVTDTANQQGSDEVVVTVLPSPVHAPVPSHDPPELPLPAKAPTVAQDVHNISEKMYPQPFPAQPLSMQTNPGAMQKQVDAVYVAPESSAVLPLALGLAVTVLLLVMLGGRFFVARKRLKKGRPLVSEESDYLINGMYL